MRLPLTGEVFQDTILTRQQKRKLERMQKKEESKLKKVLKKFSLPVSFDNNTVTAYGPFGYFEAFKKSIGLTQIINSTLNVKRHHNCYYSTSELIDFFIDSISVGLFRFYHMDGLQSDPGYKMLKNFRGGKVPDESTVRYLLSQLTDENILELQKINQSLLSLKASMEKPREVWLDLDDTVITVFGS
ncbi:hypothetical protein BR63_03685 [Thermanaerosceptrum fracticalcis]|jgi:hypothetical protein|uniref:Transposase DDE domain-containing protein n=1 Tax=Thermanaerosceptrum fracticalcis TaxID=1712410 RepID=A0A7G6E093_THEFR|nr:transposase [Thermanaerosceptrum fracticalcis]QNB45497.1 hypothetical protein BR63_03685 [Thermanaerosceptrum fracticalcis]